MAAVDLNTSYNLNLTNEEMVLVLRALGDRINAASEREKAKLLGDKLSILRANIVKDRLKQNDLLFKSLAEAGLVEGK